MSTYSITATKDGKTYAGTIVGGSPFASTLGSTTINAVVVPLKISIGSATFDPTATDTCNTTSALTAFNASPLAIGTSISFDGTPITAQYIDGFRQAEFATLVGGSTARPESKYKSTRPLRQILVDRARRHAASKRGGGFQVETLNEEGHGVSAGIEEFLILEQALSRLAEAEPRLAQVVELHYFGGLNGPEISELLGVPAWSVTRDHRLAEAWLRRELSQS